MFGRQFQSVRPDTEKKPKAPTVTPNDKKTTTDRGDAAAMREQRPGEREGAADVLALVHEDSRT